MISNLSLHSHFSEDEAYKSLVNLCNQVLSTVREGGVATNLDKDIRREEKQIEFIRYDTLSLAYDWSLCSSGSEQHMPDLTAIDPGVLVTWKDAIVNYKAEQEDIRGKMAGAVDFKFDPGDAPLATDKVRTMIGLRDVLSCVELKWNRKSRRPKTSQTSASECLA